MVYRAVFFGTPQFAATILEYIAKKPIEIVAVVTNPDKPVKRSKEPVSGPVKKSAESLAIPVYQPVKASSEEFVSFLKTLKGDLFLVAAYNEIFKENLIEVPPLAILNVHASILPKYRGAGPIQRAIWNGDSESGVSIMKIAKKMDAGGVYLIKKTAITEEMTAGELSEKLAIIGGEALWEVIEQFKRGEARAMPQEEGEVTYAPKLHSEDGFIDFSKSADESYNQIRACTPKPGAWCWIEIEGVKKRLLIKRAKKNPLLQGKPRELLISEENSLIVACSTGAVQLLEIQLESKKAMLATDFLRGIKKSHVKF